MLGSIILVSQLHAADQGGLITWKSGQIWTNWCEGGATEVTNQANMAVSGTIYACGGIIVLRGHNYVNTHTFILSTTHTHTTHHTRLVMTSEEGLDCVCLCRLIYNDCWCLLLRVFWGLFFNCVNFPDRSPGAEKSRPLRMFICVIVLYPALTTLSPLGAS